MASSQLEVSSAQQFAQDVLEGLSNPTQKWLSARYFYDEVGSALFEAITALPEYGLTRADARLLRIHANQIVAGPDNSPEHVVELGSGSGMKTKWLLEAAVSHLDEVRYTPIDVSQTALEFCQSALEMIPGVLITPQNESYLDGVRNALAGRQQEQRVMVLFLGSTIGNFTRADAPVFLRDLRALLELGDRLLLGADLVKPAEQLIDAYDDPIGVTAAFNLNVLSRLNRQLGANFDIRAFQHVARWDAEASRIEMHLRSVRAQTVRIGALGQSFRFREGETIWTESSYKFTVDGIRELARAGGFVCEDQWIDADWPFAETILSAA